MQTALINNGCDLHLQHGPIDLIIRIEGPREQIAYAWQRAESRFATVLEGLVAELEKLRQPVAQLVAQPVAVSCAFKDPTAQRMWHATNCFASTHFITPMAAVAGSVADEILAAILHNSDDLTAISVNNGGDIALWLADTHQSNVGVADPLNGTLLAQVSLHSADGIGGIATSGRHGRSLSLGVADSVTVLAQNAASADASATIIANAINLPSDHPGGSKIEKAPAITIDPDSDLGDQLVTVDVQPFSESEKNAALSSGLELAEKLVQAGRIHAAYLLLQGRTATTASFESLAAKTRLPVAKTASQKQSQH